MKDNDINAIKSLNEVKTINNVYEEINEIKMKELESTFKTSKLKVYLSDPIFIDNSKVGIIKNNCFIIYDNFQFNLLNKIELEKEVKIISVVELDNKDLILMTIKKEIKNDNYDWFSNIYIFIDQ